MNVNEDPGQSIDDSASVESSADGGEDDDLWRELKRLASTLCSRCRELAHRQIGITNDHSEYRVYHPSMSSLQESTYAGCCLCDWLDQSFHNFYGWNEPSSVSTELWSIRYRVLSDPFWRTHVDYSHGAFCLQFYLWKGDCNDAVRKSHDAMPFVTMTFFPAESLGFGPEFLSMSRAQRVHPSLL